MKPTREEVFMQAWAQYCNGKIGTRQFFDVAWDAAKADSDHVAVIGAKPDSDHLALPIETSTNTSLDAALLMPVAVWYRTERDISDEYFTNYSEGPDRPNGEGWKPLCDPQAMMAEQFRRAVDGPQSGISSPSYRPNEQNDSSSQTFEALAKRYNLSPGHETADALRWFLLGQKHSSQEGKQ